MSIREISLPDIDAIWPRLQPLFVGKDAGPRRERIKELLSGDRAYALLEEDGAIVTGLAVVEHYQSAWIFADGVASIRECISLDPDSRARLLAAIDERAHAAGMTNLQRFLTAGDASLAWWYDAGFVEYMTAFRKAIEPAPSECGPESNGAGIRVVSDVAADWPQLWPLIEKLDQHHASLTVRPLLGNREENSRSHMQEEIDSGEALVMLAEVDGDAIATSTAELGQPEPDGTRIGYRSRLYVEEPYRRRGLSVHFEAKALPWFRERGVTHVERWIVAGNERPRQIWTARGYEPARILLRKALQA